MLLDILEKDDVNALEAIMTSPRANFNAVIEDVDEGRPDMLKDRPPAISVAAFYGAEKCFEFLMQSGAKCRNSDDVS